MLKLLLVREIKKKQTHGLFKIGGMISASLFVIRLRIKSVKKLKAKQQYQQANILLLITMSTIQKEPPLILNVPNFSGVRFHGGNNENDSEGCPLWVWFAIATQF